MKRLTYLICASLLTPHVAMAEGCDHALSNLAQPLMATAIQLREDGKYQDAIEKLKTIPGNQPSSFCILYEIGRNHLRLEQYDLALTELQQASGIATEEDRQKQAIFNTIGYTWLVRKDYGKAVMAFERQLKDDQFAKLPKLTQTKVFNNIGLAYMHLSQFDQAKASFNKAKANGSELAKANLEIVNRLIAVQRQPIQAAKGFYKLAK